MTKSGGKAGSAERSGPTPGVLAAAVALASLQSLWSLFQWMQLVLARRGLDTFCGLGEGGSCTELWDSGFALAVSAWTGLPLAGWGLAWGAAAFSLALGSLARRAAGRPLGSLWPATVLCAVAGVGGVVVLASVSLLAGQICTTCLLTYLLIAAFAAVCLSGAGWRLPASTLAAAPLAVGVVVLAFLVLLYPGLRTPSSTAQTSRALLGRAAGPVADQADVAPADASGLARLIASLPDEAQQVFRESLEGYQANPALPMRAPRALEGSAGAPLRITEFTDVLCSHCATLHESLAGLRSQLGADAFALESRQFPLDAGCNPHVPGESKNPVRCLAARAQICLEEHPDVFEFAGSLFLNQYALDDALVYRLAEPYMDGPVLERCVRSAETESKLQDDIAWAMEHDIHGTPLVLVNGRKLPNFPPLLMALVVSGGDVRALEEAMSPAR